MSKVLFCLRSAVFTFFALQLHAQPEGFYLVEGEASPPVMESTGCYVVKVGKSATINWDSFSIAENETLRFEQEDSESSVINFVSGESAILGNLQSNGKIYLTHSSQVLIGPEGTVNAPSIFLVTEQGKIEVNGGLTANTFSGKGGTIHVLGKEVEIQATAVIDASGSAGEGEVLIGGSFQGMDRSIPHSQRTIVHAGAQISVDSLEEGNGGRVIIWSDENTYFYGHVNARGGAEGGDGGLVEVSGKNQLAFEGTVSTEAPKGIVGTLLMDPIFVTLVQSSMPSLPANTILFFQNQYGTMLDIGIDSVMTHLQSTNVLIQASGDIIVTANNTVIPSSTNALTFMVGGSIQFLDDVQLNLGTATFTATVNTDFKDPNQTFFLLGASKFEMGTNAFITTSGNIFIGQTERYVAGTQKSNLFWNAKGAEIVCPPSSCSSVNGQVMCCPNSFKITGGGSGEFFSWEAIVQPQRGPGILPSAGDNLPSVP